MRLLSVLGSTGSIGCQTLDVAIRHADKISIRALAAGKNIHKLISQIQEHHPSYVAVPDKESEAFLKKELPLFKGEIHHGPEALIEAASLSEVTHVLVALVGSLGLVPTLKAIESGKIVALANKETLVAGGHLVQDALKKYKGTLIPVDSEHSAIFQCLKGEELKQVHRIWLTASGGPFRGFTPAEIAHVTKEQVLSHPIWKMGDKITVDSASMMNKGLEVIEAKWLFGIPPDQIEVLVHPQGIVHSMVEFNDGSVIAQMGLPDMRTPIQVALSYPERWEAPPPRLNLVKSKPLTFEEPDLETFPLLAAAYEAAKQGGSVPTVLNSANEEAVRLFLADKINFVEISKLVSLAVKEHENIPFPNLQQVLEADAWGRKFVMERELVSKDTHTRT